MDADLLIDKMWKKRGCAAWLDKELTHEALGELVNVREGEFYYVRLPAFEANPGNFVLGKVQRRVRAVDRLSVARRMLAAPLSTCISAQ